MEIQGDQVIISLSLIPQVPLILLIICSVLPWLLATKKWRKYYSRCNDMEQQLRVLQSSLNKQYSGDKQLEEKLAHEKGMVAKLTDELKSSKLVCYKIRRIKGAPDIRIGEIREATVLAHNEEEVQQLMKHMDDLANDNWYEVIKQNNEGIVYTYYQ